MLPNQTISPAAPGGANTGVPEQDRFPYPEVIEFLRKGRVIPVLGAGVNVGQENRKVEWNTESSYLPLGGELSRFLADQSKFPEDDLRDRSDLSKVAAYYAGTVGRPFLCERLHGVFDRDFSPGPVHKFLAEIARETPLLIITTNYDDLLERAFADIRYDRVIHLTNNDEWGEAVLWWSHDPENPTAAEPMPIHPSRLDQHIDLTKTSVIYKMHGTVDRHSSDSKWDSYVITEDDYVDFLSRMTKQTAIPAMFTKPFRNRSFLFLGYGLRDWNFRVVLRDLLAGKRSVQSKSWAVQFRRTQLEKDLWESRGVTIYDADLSYFLDRLREAR